MKNIPISLEDADVAGIDAFATTLGVSRSLVLRQAVEVGMRTLREDPALCSGLKPLPKGRKPKPFEEETERLHREVDLAFAPGKLRKERVAHVSSLIERLEEELKSRETGIRSLFRQRNCYPSFVPATVQSNVCVDLSVDEGDCIHLLLVVRGVGDTVRSAKVTDVAYDPIKQEAACGDDRALTVLLTHIQQLLVEGARYCEKNGIALTNSNLVPWG